MNTKKLLRRIVLLNDNCNFEEMENACRELLKLEPNNFAALQWLGISLGKQRRFTDAITYFSKALKIYTDAKVYSNLGLVYQESGRYEDALESFQKSVKLDPNLAEGYNNLGTVYFHLKNYSKSKIAFENAIRIDPDFIIAISNLGICYKKLGLLHEAVELHLRALSLDPTSPRAYVNLFESLTYSQVTDDALQVAQAGLEFAPLYSLEQLELLVGIAINSWLSGKYDLARAAIQNCKLLFSDSFKNDKHKKPWIIFQNYIDQLLKIRASNPFLYQSDNNTEAIFFVGESHCLSPSETIVQYDGFSYRVLSTFIQGCKAWHLSRTHCNEYKKSFEILLKALPLNSKVIIGMGEIDCREDEGIYHAYRSKGIDFRLSIPEIVSNYVDYASFIAKQFSHKLIFYGVPALCTKRSICRLTGHKNLLIQIIELFNFELRKACSRHNWELLDVYSATCGEEASHYIDTHHLHPKTLGILFRSYFLSPDKP